jgi:hypothetical protein
MISSFRRNAGEVCALVGYSAAQNGNYLTTFPNNRSVPSSMINKCNKRTVPIGCPETSVRNYHYSLRNIPEQRKSSHFVWLFVCHIYDSLRDTITLWPVHFSADRIVSDRSNGLLCSNTSIWEILWRNFLCLKFTPISFLLYSCFIVGSHLYHRGGVVYLTTPLTDHSIWVTGSNECVCVCVYIYVCVCVWEGGMYACTMYI